MRLSDLRLLCGSIDGSTGRTVRARAHQLSREGLLNKAHRQSNEVWLFTLRFVLPGGGLATLDLDFCTQIVTDLLAWMRQTSFPLLDQNLQILGFSEVDTSCNVKLGNAACYKATTMCSPLLRLLIVASASVAVQSFSERGPRTAFAAPPAHSLGPSLKSPWQRWSASCRAQEKFVAGQAHVAGRHEGAMVS